MKGTPTKTARNLRLVKDKATMTFRELAKKYKMSDKRAKEIYYRELKKVGNIKITKKYDN